MATGPNGDACPIRYAACLLTAHDIQLTSRTGDMIRSLFGTNAVISMLKGRLDP
jgi:hypothetical protein